MEPKLHCISALRSPNTGIVDSHAPMLALQGAAESHGAMAAFQSPVEGLSVHEDHVVLTVGGQSGIAIRARTVVVAAGLASCTVAKALGACNVPQTYLCKGGYFSLTGRSPFHHLVYAVPVTGGPGIHYTVDLGGRSRFGLDVEWLDDEDYRFDPAHADSLYAVIRSYWPGLQDDTLEPAYADTHSKISVPGAAAADFQIADTTIHGFKAFIALYRIETPGLTSSLAIAEQVRALCDVAATT